MIFINIYIKISLSNQIKMFLINKYSPQILSDSLTNNDILKQLMHIALFEDIPHIILSGPVGSGKKTLVKFFLEAIYDKNINILSKTKYKITGASKKNIIEIAQSDYHIVIEPTSTNHDKYILQEIIKQYAMHKTFDIFETKRKFKTIVIHNIECLSYNSQAALRRTMELYANSCRFIMICNNSSKIFEALRSRCHIFCVPQPSLEEIKKIIIYISLNENIKLSGEDMTTIIKRCNNNVKEAIWILDEMKHGVPHDLPLYVAYDKVVKLILSTIKGKNVVLIFDKKIRSKIHDIWTNTISGTDIIINIMERLIEIINIDHINIKIIQFAADAECNMVPGRRDNIHIDMFISNVIRELIVNKESLTHLL
jgi:replication factor C subunit 3/5